MDLYRDADNAMRVREVASEDARRRGLRPRAHPRRPGVSVIACYSDASRMPGGLIAHLDRERDQFWRQNLDLDAVIVTPRWPDEEAIGPHGPDVPPWVSFVAAQGSIHAAVNVAACELAKGDALLLVESPIADASRGSPVLAMYSHLTATSAHGIVAPILYCGGDPCDPGLRYAHAKDHVGCGFTSQGGALASEKAAPIDATASSCLMIRREVFVEIGGLDQELPADLARVALCVAADRLGYRTHRLNVGVLHALDAERQPRRLDFEDAPRFARRWGAYLECRFG